MRQGVISRQGGEPVWIPLGDDPAPDEYPDIYLARVDWLPGGDLAVQVENRLQTCLDLYRCDPRSGRRTLLLRETSEVWINLHNMFKPIEEGGIFKGFLWASERSGYRHLYLYDDQGRFIRQLTGGDWVVDDLAAVDQANQMVYFTASSASPLESHLYAVSFEGGEIRRITEAPGMHSVVIDPACRRFVDTCQALAQPPILTLRSSQDGSLICPVCDRPDPRVEQLALQPPELVSLCNRQGDQLYGAVYRPPASFGSGPYPAIVSVYGGPHAQVVTNSWNMTCNMRAQYLRSLGYLVFMLDNRGSARRGLVFEAPLKWNMGNHEVEDQVDGVRWLIEQGLADPQRVGIYGWSYGGYMAALCLARAPEVFKVAVAGAPVTHYDGYDTHYTERYMGLPQANPQGYEEGSVLKHVENMRGKLMLVHGMIDENVHFRHTARLINALIQARKPYDLLLFPDERHMPRKPADRVYMEQLISEYFVKNL